MEPMQWLTLIVFGLTILAVITNIIDSTLAALTVGISVADRRQLISTLEQLKLNLIAAEKAAEALAQQGMEDDVRQHSQAG